MTHLAVHSLDRPHWSAPTVCGKFKRKRDQLHVGKSALIDCPGCRWWIDGWTPKLVVKMFENAEEI